MTNGTTESPASPNAGQPDSSVYYDATENRVSAIKNTCTCVENNKSKVPSSTVAPITVPSTVSLREHKDNKDNKDRETTSRPHSTYSKIPVPVKSPRCSISESTPETNTTNTRTGVATGSESVAQNSQLKEKDSGELNLNF